MLSLVVGTPWLPVPSQADDDEVPVMIRIIAGSVVPAAALPPAIVPRGPEELGRRVYLGRKKELDRYGYTDLCPGCMAAFLKGPAVEHTEACRTRITEAMRGPVGRHAC